MANLGQTYKVDELPQNEYEPIPAGTYNAMIMESEIKDSSTGGQYVQLRIEITGPTQAGRSVFERLNIRNQNEKAVQIALQTLGSICKAVGLNSVSDTNELHNRPFKVTLDVEQGKPYEDKITGEMKQGNPQNRIKKYEKAETSAAATAYQSADSLQSPTPVGQTSADVPVWGQ